MVEEVLAEFGKIDVLVNNAGISMRASFANIDVSVLKKVMDVNFGAQFIAHVMRSLALLKIRVLS